MGGAILLGSRIAPGVLPDPDPVVVVLSETDESGEPIEVTLSDHNQRTTSEVIAIIESGEVESVTAEIRDGVVVYELKLESGVEIEHPAFDDDGRNRIVDALNEAEVEIEVSTSLFRFLLGLIAPILMLGTGSFLLFGDRIRSATSDGALAGSTSEYTIYKTLPERLDDVKGYPEVVLELREIAQEIQRYRDIRLANKGKKTADQQKLPKRRTNGIMIYGPPGTGKTLSGRAMAGEAGVPFIFVPGSALIGEYVGWGERRVRSLYNRARKLEEKYGGCVIMIDEIDSFGLRRSDSASSDSKDYTSQILNELLARSDQVYKEGLNIVTLGTTNRFRAIDPALKRGDRLGHHIHMPLPNNWHSRAEILQVHLDLLGEGDDPVELADDVDARELAQMMANTSGDDLGNIVKTADEIRKRRGLEKLEQASLVEALQRVLIGAERHDPTVTLEERMLVAHHEMGHGVMAVLSQLYALERLGKEQRGVSVVSLKERGGALAHVIPSRDGVSEKIANRRDLLTGILISIGGRASEHSLFGTNGETTGADGDLDQIENVFLQMMGSGILNGRRIEQTYLQSGGRFEPQDAALKNLLMRQARSTVIQILNLVSPEHRADVVNEMLEDPKDFLGEEAEAEVKRYLGDDFPYEDALELMKEFFDREFPDIAPGQVANVSDPGGAESVTGDELAKITPRAFEASETNHADDCLCYT